MNLCINEIKFKKKTHKNNKKDNNELGSQQYKLGVKMSTKCILLDFSLTVKAATLIFISGCVSAISSAKEGKSGFIYNLLKSK